MYPNILKGCPDMSGVYLTLVGMLSHVISGAMMLPRFGRSRLVIGLLWCVVTVILASYSATLTSYLTVDVTRLPFSSLKQVIQFPSYQIWTNPESVFAEIFQVSIIVIYMYMYHSLTIIYITHVTFRYQRRLHGPLATYVKSRVAHAPGMPGTFSPPQTWKETAS